MNRWSTARSDRFAGVFRHESERWTILRQPIQFLWRRRPHNRNYGLDLVQVIHLNDSKVPRGKRVDRHEHIGHGHIPLSAFRELVNHHHFRSIPKILETAKEVSPDGRPWDIVNLATLDQLGKRPTKRNLNTQKRIKV